MRILFCWIHHRLDKDNMYPLAEKLEEMGFGACRVVTYDAAWKTDPDKVDVLVVGHDWSKFTKPLVEKFRKAGVFTVLLQHEGLYTDEEKWYNASYPICHLALAWGKKHKQVWKERGTQSAVHVVGPVRWDLYQDFEPRDKTLPFKNPLVFATQQWDLEGDVERLHHLQRQYIEYLAELSHTYDGDIILKVHPGHDVNTKLGFNYHELARGSRMTVIKNEYDVHSLMYHAKHWITYSSTTSIERAILGKPSIILCEDSHPIIDLCGFERFSIEEFEGNNSITPDGLAKFHANFTKGIDGQSCERAALAIHATAEKFLDINANRLKK